MIDDCAWDDPRSRPLILVLWPLTEGEGSSYGCFFVQLPASVSTEQSPMACLLTENRWWEYWYPCNGRNPCRCLPHRHISDCEKLTKLDHRMLYSSFNLWDLFQQLGACIPGWLHRVLSLYFDLLLNSRLNTHPYSREGSTLHQFTNSACEHYERHGMDLLRYPKERHTSLHDQFYRIHHYGRQPAFLPLGCRFSIIWVHLDSYFILRSGLSNWWQERKWGRLWSRHWKRPRRVDYVKGRHLGKVSQVNERQRLGSYG